MESPTCVRCGRFLLGSVPNGRGIKYPPTHGPLVRAYATHASKGCDTGCCGYIVEAEDAEGNTCEGPFEFDHPDNHDDARTWLTSLVDHEFPGVPIDFERCDVVLD